MLFPNNRNMNEEQVWSVIKKYFSQQHLGRCVRHQTESYNDFIINQIPNTIAMFNPVLIRSDHTFNEEHNKNGWK